MHSVPRLFTLLFFAAAALSCAGCSATSGTSSLGTATSANCMAPPSAPIADKPVIAVLDGITTNDRNTSIIDERVLAMHMILNAGFDMKARLILDTIGSGIGDADLVANTQLEGDGPNALLLQANIACKISGSMNALATLDHRSSTGPVDVLGALATLAGHLNGLSHRQVDVVLMSSLLNGTRELDLANSSTLAQNPSGLLAGLARKGLIPSCVGWNVYALGAGESAGGGLSDVEFIELRVFWTDFFQRCGGRLVFFDSEFTHFPISPSSSGPSDTGLSVSRRVTGNGQTEIVIRLESSVLFASGKNNLAANDSPALRSLLSLLTVTYPIGPIRVVGFTDSVPINVTGGNLLLSKERAAAVGRWLVARGVATTRIRTLGMGPADPIDDNGTPAGRAQNRRVEVSVTLPRGAS